MQLLSVPNCSFYTAKQPVSASSRHFCLKNATWRQCTHTQTPVWAWDCPADGTEFKGGTSSISLIKGWQQLLDGGTHKTYIWCAFCQLFDRVLNQDWNFSGRQWRGQDTILKIIVCPIWILSLPFPAYIIFCWWLYYTNALLKLLFEKSDPLMLSDLSDSLPFP